LNDFALHVVPQVVEVEHLGRVIYAGGDDVLAMLPVSDLLSAMQRLRRAYSGTSRHDRPMDWRSLRRSKELVCKDGFAYLSGRLMRMMGQNATASGGAVIAHHQAPLSAVLRELREAEKRPKNEGERDAFSLTVIKRSGGATSLTGKWDILELLLKLRDFLAAPEVSRQAVYHSIEWLTDLPENAEKAMTGALLRYQLQRQTASADRFKALGGAQLADQLAIKACEQRDRTKWLQIFLSTAEFIARETRAPVCKASEPSPVDR